MGRALLNVTQIRALERAAADRLAPGTLMQRAGRAAAAWIAQQAPLTPEPLLILCGPGNNGGDGLACATALRASGQPAICWMPIAPRAADGAAALAAYRAAGGTTFAEWPPPQPFAAVVDALFGIGLARPLADPYLGALRWLGDHARPAPVYALDLPSGLDADTGSWVGGCRGLAAHATITFLADKPGLHTLDGVDAAGRVVVDTLAIDGQVQAAHTSRIQILDPGDFAALLRPRLANSHKGTYGDVLVAGGGTGMVGAALLAARAALRLGAGRVFVEIVESDLRRLDPCQPELMFRSRGGTGPVDAIAVGCGLGVGVVSLAALEATLDCDAAVLVADADALNLMSQHDALRARFIKRPATRVVTPHPLEAARLLGRDSAQVQADRVGAALALADALQAIAVLKGAGSVVATPDGRAWINPTGGPALATAGAGDVLSGMIAALCAQGHDALQGVLAAVWLHGAAAAEHGADIGLVAGEIAPLAVRAWTRLRARH
jgi:hydroxyethylthiazole kinase-like uncharacterized protein yjeF